MRKLCGLCLLACFLTLGTSQVRSGEGDAAWGWIDKAIKAAGGEENLKKHRASTWSEKGTHYGLGGGPQPYTAKMAAQFPGQFRMQLFAGNFEFELFILVLNNDKGWTKRSGLDGKVSEMTAKELKNHKVNARAGWIMSLLPLKDKAFTLTVIDGIDVDGKPTAGVKVTRADYPEVKLFFDRQSGLLVMSQNPAFSIEQGKMVQSETRYQNYKLMDGAQVPTHIIVKHDGKLFVETDIHDLKAAGTLDAKVFAAPK
jgi:hypothetical protein